MFSEPHTPALEVRRMSEISNEILNRCLELPVSKEELKAALTSAASIVEQSITVDQASAAVARSIQRK